MKDLRTRTPLGGKGYEMTRIYPNGECVVFRQRIKSMPCIVSRKRYTPYVPVWVQLRNILMLKSDPLHPDKVGWWAVALFMGLSLVRNFDRVENAYREAGLDIWEEVELPASINPSGSSENVLPSGLRPSRYGANGITRRGARTVRCACHLLQKTYGRGRLTFATCTVPGMPVEHLRRLQQEWGKVVELYRLTLSRVLQKQGLRGEIITVTEIQPERHKKTGFPVLHIHSVFVGRLPYGGWAVPTERHDDIWRAAVLAVIPEALCHFRSACNLQEVKTSASGYLGKYMTKSAALVGACVADGFAEVMPRQWWNCTRSLKEWVNAETVEGSEVSSVLLDAISSDDKSVWEFCGHVTLDIESGKHYWLASYGRLTAPAAQQLREVLGWEELRSPERRGLAFVT